MEYMKNFLIITVGILLILVLGIYSAFVEPNKLKVTHYTLQDKELSGIKIVFASDFHIRPYQQKRLEKVVEYINKENPDLVLSTGDFVAGHTKRATMSIEDIAKVLGQVKSKYGFYTTQGNHDGWYGNERISKALKENGIKELDNSNVKLSINGKTLYLAGIEDLMTGKPDIYKALDKTQKPTILLTHTPDMFTKIYDDVNLVLAGHTHGGQVRIPLLGPIFTASKYNDKYAKGLISENNKKMIVTAGIGASIIPIRFNCTPEIVVIEFE